MELRRTFLSAFARVTSDGRFIPEIDGLRFLAISSVAMYHLLGYLIAKSPVTFTDTRASSWLAVTLGRGWFGVELFFVISGFVICLPFARHFLQADKAVELKRYYLRRVTRLEPPYMICVTAFFVLDILVRNANVSSLWTHYLATLTYSHNLLYGYKSTVAEIAWSLEIEIQFYVLAPFVARLFVLPTVLRRGALIAAILMLCAIQPFLHGLRLNVLFFGQFFLIGFLLADFYLTGWPARRYADVLAIPIVAGLFAITGGPIWFDARIGSLRDALFCIGACAGLFALFWSAFNGRLLKRFITQHLITVIGGMCYTTYLYHEYIYSLIGRVAIKAHFTQSLAVNYGIIWVLMFPAMLAIASVLFLLFEKPFMQKRWWSHLLGYHRAVEVSQ